MYSIQEHGQMIADRVRTRAYARALKASVRPGCVVLDLGSGTGIFGLLACRYGARKVYSVEASDAIAVAQRIAQANGLADRIVFIQDVSLQVALAEKADVIVADLHGTLPLFKSNVASILDARRRMLADGGVLIPRRESLWAAVVEAPDEYDRLVSPWARDDFDLDMQAAREAVTNSMSKAVVSRDQLLSRPRCWGELDYLTLESPSHAATVTFAIERPGSAHGLILWFDSNLADGIGLSNAPGEPVLVYRSSFLPWTSAIPLEVDDRVSVRLRADFTGTDYLWSWESEVHEGGTGRSKAHLRQSTFWGSPLSPGRLHRRSNDFRPTLGTDGQVDALILGTMNGTRSLEEIAHVAMARFPARFASFAEALARVGDLSETYDRRSTVEDVTPQP